MTRCSTAADGTGESVRNEIKQKLKTGTFRSLVRPVFNSTARIVFCKKRIYRLAGKTKVGDPCVEPY